MLRLKWLARLFFSETKIEIIASNGTQMMIRLRIKPSQPMIMASIYKTKPTFSLVSMFWLIWFHLTSYCYQVWWCIVRFELVTFPCLVKRLILYDTVNIRREVVPLLPLLLSHSLIHFLPVSIRWANKTKGKRWQRYREEVYHYIQPMNSVDILVVFALKVASYVDQV